MIFGPWVNRTMKKRYMQEISKIPPWMQGGGLCLVLTSRCNFACKHCMRDMEHPKDMPFEIVEKSVLSALKYQFHYVSLTGGEPLVYPRVRDVMDLAAQNGCGLNMATNGYLLMDFSDIILKYRDRFHFIQFSLEDIDKKQHDQQRNAGSYDKLMEAFRFCRENNIPFRIATASSTVNFDKIFDIALFAKKKGAFSVIVTTVLPCPRGSDNRLVLDAQKRNQLYETVPGMAKLLDFPVSTSIEVHASGNKIEFCPSLNQNGLTIDPDGNVVQCCVLANFDDSGLKQRSIIASLKEKSFDEAMAITAEYFYRWHSERIKDYQRRTDTDSIGFNSCFYCLQKLSKT